MMSLEKQGLVSADVVQQVFDFCKSSSVPVVPKISRLNNSLEKRMELSKHPVALNLLQLMISKQSNLCVAADLPKLEDVIVLAEKIGSKIIVLKIHVDIFEDFSESKIIRLKELSKMYNFLIMEDR